MPVSAKSHQEMSLVPGLNFQDERGTDRQSSEKSVTQELGIQIDAGYPLLELGHGSKLGSPTFQLNVLTIRLFSFLLGEGKG